MTGVQKVLLIGSSRALGISETDTTFFGSRSVYSEYENL